MDSRRRRAIVALMSTRTIAEAAEAAKLTERTIYRFLNEPAFRAELAEAERSAIKAAARQLVRLQGRATLVIDWAMIHPDNPAHVRLRAAIAAIDLNVKIRTLEIEERLAALEERVHEQNNG